MFKRLLLCFALAISSTSWGDVVSAQANVEVQTQGGELAKESIYTEAQSIASPKELEAFEKLALTEPKRALELSMYYQGWGKDKCFYVFDDEKSDSPITRTYVKNSEISRQIEMRDFDKALHFAEIAFEKKSERVNIKRYNNDPIVLNLMKLYILRGENFAKETYNFFIEKVANLDFEKEGKIYGGDFSRRFDGDRVWAFNYSKLYFYFYFKGFGVKQDMEFAKSILKYLYIKDWRSFYASKYYPKDLELAKSIIETHEDSIVGNHYLYLIYSGKFNPEEKNEALAQSHFDLYEKSLNESIERDIINSLDKIKNSRNTKIRLTNFYLTKYFFYGLLYDEALLIPNPYYNIELAKENSLRNMPFSGYRLLIIFLQQGYSVVEAKKYYEEMLKSENGSDEDKAKYKAHYLGTYHNTKRVLCEDQFNDLIKIDFDSL